MFRTLLVVIVLSLTISNGNLYEAKLIHGENLFVNLLDKIGRIQTRNSNPSQPENLNQENQEVGNFSSEI